MPYVMQKSNVNELKEIFLPWFIFVTLMFLLFMNILSKNTCHVPLQYDRSNFQNSFKEIENCEGFKSS